jgi:D-xylose transport system substrate-binding protein
MKIATKRAAMATAAIMLAALSLTACTNGAGASSTSTTSAASAKTAKIGLLLPDSVTPRYAADDHPMFAAKLKSLCPKCTLLYADADGDAAKQQQQADSMLTEGAKVLVVDAEDGEAAASIVADAKKQHVPVIAYDRLIDSPDLSYYISFVNQKVGKLQATALIDRMKQLGIPAGSGIIQINGSPTDNNATQFAQGADSVLDNKKLDPYKILASYQTPNWDGTLAQNWAASQITQFGSQIKGIYAANDTTGQGALAALKAANFSPIPPITGQDATLAGIQDILSGLQYMTVYKPILPEANQAAVLAYDLAQGKHPKAPTTTKTQGTAGPSTAIPSFLLQPEAVTASNIESTVMKDKFYTYAQVCTPQYVAMCKKYGITNK